MEAPVIARQKYLDQLMRFRDRGLIKVVTGVRRCGKSTLLDMARELAPLRAIRDAYPKMVVALRGGYPADVDGIRIVPAADFLLHRA